MHKLRPCLQKIRYVVLTYSFISLLAPIGPKVVLSLQTPKATLATWKVFSVKLDKVLRKIILYSWKFDNFDKVVRVTQKEHRKGYTENYKKTIKNSVFGATLSMKFPVHSCPPKPTFWNTKIQISLKSKAIMKSYQEL